MIDDEYFATCPYNATHRVPRSRLQHHLIKCEKNNPKLWICPFNATHRYPEELKQHHCATCPSKPVDEPHPKAKTAGTVGVMTAPKQIQENEYEDPENEYWD